MADSSRLTALVLKRFKTYRDVEIPIKPLTVIIGRNASGKSNALDALEILGRFARGLSIAESLDGSIDGLPAVRGGIDGAAPAGQKGLHFSIGVRVSHEELGDLAYEVKVSADDNPRVLEERLTQRTDRGPRPLLETIAQEDAYRSDIDARVYSANRGVNPRATFRSSQTIAYQAIQRLEPDTASRRLVIRASNVVLGALLGVFHLDPVPSRMRQYVSEKDTELRRDGSNVSAVLAQLNGRRGDHDHLEAVSEAIKALPEHPIHGLTFANTSFGDVMVALREDFGPSHEVIPARQMSDGMLRMMAIATAVLGGGSNLALAPSLSGEQSPATVVVEELENGLHPSQAETLLRLILAATEKGEQLVITTHSPALLNALRGQDHPGVVIVSRDSDSGWSRVDRLVDLPGYSRALASDSLGGLVESGRIVDAFESAKVSSVDVERILGVVQ